MPSRHRWLPGRPADGGRLGGLGRVAATMPGRRGPALTLAAVVLPLLVVILVPFRDSLTLPSDLLVFMLGVFVVALAGDWVAALVAAVAAVLLLNYYFTPPLHTLTIADRDHVVALVVFVAVAIITSSLVGAVTRRTRQAAEAAAEVATRTALLRAVSHDLRTPLASAKAAVEGLRSPEVSWSPDEQRELLTTAKASIDRLTSLVENLLDMSRLQAGALSVFPRAIAVEDVVAHAVREVDPQRTQVVVQVADDLPEIWADPPLLERVLANLLTNALRFSPPGQPPHVTAYAVGVGAGSGSGPRSGSGVGAAVEVWVVDRGPGVPDARLATLFEAFQRRGDRDNTNGLGLGLALARGLAEAMGGTLRAEHTPGGGLTMVVRLPVALAAPAVIPPGSREQAITDPRERP